MNWTIAIPYLMIDDGVGALETATGKCFVNLEV